MFEDRRAGDIDVGVITLNPDANLQKVRKNLAAILPKDVKIMTLPEFISLEKAYWNLRTPIGFVFKIMVTMGFVVGIGITYQILYTNISSHLIEYATLKAIGFANQFFLSIVFQQASFLAVLGYVPGFIIAFGVYDVAKDATNLPVIMTIHKVITVFISVVVMCIFSGILALHKLSSADPADIF